MAIVFRIFLTCGGGVKGLKETLKSRISSGVKPIALSSA